MAKLSWVEAEEREHHAVVCWLKNGDSIENFWTSLKEAKTDAKQLKRERSDIKDIYIRHYDENGCFIRDYEV